MDDFRHLFQSQPRGLGDYYPGVYRPRTYYGDNPTYLYTTDVLPPRPGDTALVGNTVYIFITGWVELGAVGVIESNYMYVADSYYELISQTNMPIPSIGCVRNSKYAGYGGSNGWRSLTNVTSGLEEPAYLGERNGDVWVGPATRREDVNLINVGSMNEWSFIGSNKVSAIQPPHDNYTSSIVGASGQNQYYTIGSLIRGNTSDSIKTFIFRIRAKKVTGNVVLQAGIISGGKRYTLFNQPIIIPNLNEYKSVSTNSFSPPLDSFIPVSSISGSTLFIYVVPSTNAVVQVTTIECELVYNLDNTKVGYMFSNNRSLPFTHWIKENE